LFRVNYPSALGGGKIDATEDREPRKKQIHKWGPRRK